MYCSCFLALATHFRLVFAGLLLEFLFTWLDRKVETLKLQVSAVKI